MSSKVKIKLNKSGVRELLKSSEAQGICMDYAQQIAGVAGAGFEAEEHNGKNRNGATVITRTEEAYFSNLKNNTLVKAVQASKGGLK